MKLLSIALLIATTSTLTLALPERRPPNWHVDDWEQPMHTTDLMAGKAATSKPTSMPHAPTARKPPSTVAPTSAAANMELISTTTDIPLALTARMAGQDSTTSMTVVTSGTELVTLEVEVRTIKLYSILGMSLETTTMLRYPESTTSSLATLSDDPLVITTTTTVTPSSLPTSTTTVTADPLATTTTVTASPLAHKARMAGEESTTSARVTTLGTKVVTLETRVITREFIAPHGTSRTIWTFFQVPLTAYSTMLKIPSSITGTPSKRQDQVVESGTAIGYWTKCENSMLDTEYDDDCWVDGHPPTTTFLAVHSNTPVAVRMAREASTTSIGYSTKCLGPDPFGPRPTSVDCWVDGHPPSTVTDSPSKPLDQVEESGTASGYWTTCANGTFSQLKAEDCYVNGHPPTTTYMAVHSGISVPDGHHPSTALLEVHSNTPVAVRMVGEESTTSTSSGYLTKCVGPDPFGPRAISVDCWVDGSPSTIFSPAPVPNTPVAVPATPAANVEF